MLLHRYHFVLNNKLYENIIAEAKNQKISISELVRTIIKKMGFMMEKIQFESNPRNFEYLYVGADSRLIVKLNIETYWMIANIQDSLKLYSKAQLIRYILELYFELRSIFENKALLSILASWGEKWEEEKKIVKSWEKAHMRHSNSKNSINFFYSGFHELTKIMLI